MGAIEQTEKAYGIQSDKLSQNVSYEDLVSKEFTDLTKEKDVVILYYFSEFWFNATQTQAVDDFEALVREFAKLDNPKIKFVKFDMSKNYPSAMKIKPAEAPIIRLHNYSRDGGFIDFYYVGDSETEILNFVVPNSSHPDEYEGKIR